MTGETAVLKLRLEAKSSEFGHPLPGPFRSFQDQEWLVLMQMVGNDQFDNPDKPNTAYMLDGNFLPREGDPLQRITFNSAINAFPSQFYQKALGLDAVSFLARLDAPYWRIQVFSQSIGGLPNLLSEVEGEGFAEQILTLPLDRPAAERLFVSIISHGQLTADVLSWAVPKPEQCAPIGVSITTYNKPEYVLPNLDILRRSGAFKAGLIDLLVVNNGDPIEGVPEDVTVIPADNVGGTGGFLQGRAHFQDKGYDHFVIMDDDIVIPPDFMDRLYAVSCLNKGQHVGSLAEVQNIAGRIIKEQGADVSKGHMFGLDLNNFLLDCNEWGWDKLYKYREHDYSGWWALLVSLDPACPTPPPYFFIKRDDISFGYESRQAGVPTVVFPNLIVAHSEEGAASYYYYDIRNDLIMRSRNAGMSISVSRLATIVGGLFLVYRLDSQRMFNAALRDYMRGPQELAKVPVSQKLREIRKLAAKPVSVPKDHPVIYSEVRTPPWRMLAAWFRPKAWRVPDPIPVADSEQRGCVTEIGGYIERRKFSSMGFRHERKLACVPALLWGLVLIAVFALRRGHFVSKYK